LADYIKQRCFHRDIYINARYFQAKFRSISQSVISICQNNNIVIYNFCQVGINVFSKKCLHLLLMRLVSAELIQVLIGSEILIERDRCKMLMDAKYSIECGHNKYVPVNKYQQKSLLDQMWSYEKLVGFDLETTGLDIKSAIPVSYAFCTFKGRSLEQEEEHIIDPGIEIPKEASKIHGITTEVASQSDLKLKVAIGHIYHTIIRLAEDQVPLVGMNLTYDLTIVELLSRKLLGKSLSEAKWNGPAIDVLVIDRFKDKNRAGSRNLVALCHHYSVLNRRPHQASSDAVSACEILFQMADKFGLDNIQLSDLFSLQKSAYKKWAESYNSFLVSQNRRPLSPDQFFWPIYQY